MTRAVVAVLALVLAAGCGDGCSKRRDASSEDAAAVRRPRWGLPSASREVELCLRGVRAITSRAERCEGGSAWWGSVERAVEQLRPSCEAMAVAPGIRWSPEHVDACADAVAKAPCGAPSPEPCRNRGTLAKGSACAFGAQCGAGMGCTIARDAACGKCEPVPRDGEVCAGSCDEGLSCIGGRCAKQLAEGAACVGVECARGLYCVASKCRTPLREGEPCESFDCAPELRCESGVCKKREAPRKPGAPCTDALDCLDFSCVAGLCAAPGEIGEPCPEPAHSDRPQCAPSLVCIKGACRARDALACE